LLAAAFCYFFRREVETNDELAHGLFFDGLRQLSASQAKAFGEVGKALASLGGQFDALFEQLGRIEAAVEETHTVAVETHGAVLDMQSELQRLGGLHLANAGEVRSLLEQVQQRVRPACFQLLPSTFLTAARPGPPRKGGNSGTYFMLVYRQDFGEDDRETTGRRGVLHDFPLSSSFQSIR
jgi:hypothetical protein